MPGANSQFARSKVPVCSGQNFDVNPWGWNSALRAALIRQGIDERHLPSPTYLEAVRQLSHRRVSSTLLPQLQADGTIGESCVIKNCWILKDAKVGPYCYIKGASKLKNVTINSSEKEP